MNRAPTHAPRPDTLHGWRRRVWAFWVALRGVGILVRREVHARVHLVATLAVVALGLWLQIPRRDWPPLLLAMGLVWTAEALNSALEAALDALHPEVHPAIGRAKDLAAGGVLLAAMAAAAVGLLILGPPLLGRLARMVH